MHQTSKPVSTIEADYSHHTVLKDRPASYTHITDINPKETPLPPILGSYNELLYTLCDSCDNSSEDYKYQLMVCCSICDRKWHEDCLSEENLTAEAKLDAGETWVCPACIIPHGGEWDKAM